VKTKNPPRTELSRDAIVDRALAIADAEGRDAITIRRLAQEFGVTPMALYWHVRNKDELLDAMGDRFFDHIDYVAEGDWLDQLGGTLNSIIAALKAHPASAHLAAARLLACPRGQVMAERTLGMLREQGFSVAQATDIGRTAIQTAAMLVTEQAGAEPGVAMAEREQVRETKRAALSALPIDEFPNLRACVDSITDCEDEDAYFEFGVELFLSGVRELHAAQLPA
jgi:TetR/AcrR family transcriptional regulator, tetracycline repressor protein